MYNYTNQNWFCNNCGRSLYTELIYFPYGSRFKCCSKECNKEIEWKQILSNLKKKYYPDTYKETK